MPILLLIMTTTAKNDHLTLNYPKSWNWRGFSITYQQQGQSGPSVVFVHGFGASWGHWRKNLLELGQNCRCYAIDLIGFGESDKPKPKTEIDYTFETWGQLVGDFCREVVKEPVFLVGNSIGCVVVMQTAVDNPEWVLGLGIINCSLRLLNERKRVNLPFYRNIGAAMIQNLLGNAFVGGLFFKQIANRNTVKKVLLQAYARKEAVTEELIDMLMKPAQDEGAKAVFLAFTRYSQGPIPEDLLPKLACPTFILWGTEDPWEPIEEGEKFANYPMVKQFIPLEGVGHCPQDEAPELVNPILLDWIEQVKS